MENIYTYTMLLVRHGHQREALELKKLYDELEQKIFALYKDKAYLINQIHLLKAKGE